MNISDYRYILFYIPLNPIDLLITDYNDNYIYMHSLRNTWIMGCIHLLYNNGPLCSELLNIVQANPNRLLMLIESPKYYNIFGVSVRRVVIHSSNMIRYKYMPDYIIYHILLTRKIVNFDSIITRNMNGKSLILPNEMSYTFILLFNCYNNVILFRYLLDYMYIHNISFLYNVTHEIRASDYISKADIKFLYEHENEIIFKNYYAEPRSAQSS